MSITKKRKRVNDYQKQYEPPTLTEDEQERVRLLRDAKLCNAEVERVARNIAAAIANPQTPKTVREYIRAYLDDHFFYDFTEMPEAILCLFPIVCRKISQIPFVPHREHLEALTGNDRKRAIAATKEDHDYKPHKSITPERVAELTDALMELDQDDTEEKAAALVALIDGIGLEVAPSLRKLLVSEACHRAYSHTVRYSDEEFAFIDRAINTTRKLKAKGESL
jgi:hypothetical protein